jgi:ATP synthase protein I
MTRVAHSSGVGPFQAVLWRMVYATLAAALIAWVWQGHHGAISALLGGIINIVAGAIFAWVVARGHGRTAGGILRTAIRAEVSKVALVFSLLWLVLVHYRQVVPAVFFGTFILTVVIFSMAILVREK